MYNWTENGPNENNRTEACLVPLKIMWEEQLVDPPMDYIQSLVKTNSIQ